MIYTPMLKNSTFSSIWSLLLLDALFEENGQVFDFEKMSQMGQTSAHL